jgi:hypothetical protein
MNGLRGHKKDPLVRLTDLQLGTEGIKHARVKVGVEEVVRIGGVERGDEDRIALRDGDRDVVDGHLLGIGLGDLRIGQERGPQERDKRLTPSASMIRI